MTSNICTFSYEGFELRTDLIDLKDIKSLVTAGLDCLRITFTQGFRFQAIHLQSSMAEVILKHKITMSLTNIDIHVLLI